VLPCPGGWLVMSAKLQGVSMAAQSPEMHEQFTDVLDSRPPFAVAALHLPLGLLDQPMRGGRNCDRAARQLLGRPRAAAVASPPTREELARWKAGGRPEVSAVTLSLLRRIAEVYEVIGSYHQRSVFEAHPELSFYQLNGDRPMRFAKNTVAGRAERAGLVEARIPGAENVLRRPVQGARLQHLIDGLALLWTARRLRARGVQRLPELPEWDTDGLRMEIVF
jgi:predicted RNase H-like nuclease